MLEFVIRLYHFLNITNTTYKNIVFVSNVSDVKMFEARSFLFFDAKKCQTSLNKPKVFVSTDPPKGGRPPCFLFGGLGDPSDHKGGLALFRVKQKDLSFFFAIYFVLIKSEINCTFFLFKHKIQKLKKVNL